MGQVCWWRGLFPTHLGTAAFYNGLLENYRHVPWARPLVRNAGYLLPPKKTAAMLGHSSVRLVKRWSFNAQCQLVALDIKSLLLES
jgi:hypothetical protein